MNKESSISSNTSREMSQSSYSSYYSGNSSQDLQAALFVQSMTRKNVQPVDRPLNSQIKGKNQFICAGSLFTVDDRYEFIKRVGFGAYGVVCSAQDKITNTKVAIKKVPKAFQDLVDAKRILREIKILKFFDHENIVSLLDIQKPPQPTNYDDVYIITELMDSDLHKLIYSKQRLTDEHYQYFMYQLLRGVLYLHSANIMHRDLKPSNILVDINCDLKICDFGLARGFGSQDIDQDFNNTVYVVTRWYRAPEVILMGNKYNESLDVWSIGCIFAEMMLKQTLFPGQHNLHQIDKIIEILGYPDNEELDFINNDHSLNYIKKLPKNRTPINWEKRIPDANPLAIDLLKKMLSFSPEKRITIIDSINHPYFQSFSNLGQPPKSEITFDWSWDCFELNKTLLQKLIYMESLKFHPDDIDISDSSTTPPLSKNSEKNEEVKEDIQIIKEDMNQQQQSALSTPTMKIEDVKTPKSNLGKREQISKQEDDIQKDESEQLQEQKRIKE